jgi:hypothetical protein
MKLLNERITKDKIPCYYWSLKRNFEKTDFATQFLKLFGVEEAVGQDKIVKNTVSANMLVDVLGRLKKENGAPCVFVMDDAQVNIHALSYLYFTDN